MVSLPPAGAGEKLLACGFPERGRQLHHKLGDGGVSAGSGLDPYPPESGEHEVLGCLVLP